MQSSEGKQLGAQRCRACMQYYIKLRGGLTWWPSPLEPVCIMMHTVPFFSCMAAAASSSYTSSTTCVTHIKTRYGTGYQYKLGIASVLCT